LGQKSLVVAGTAKGRELSVVGAGNRSSEGGEEGQYIDTARSVASIYNIGSRIAIFCKYIY
jgi:hypothetical protein